MHALSLTRAHAHTHTPVSLIGEESGVIIDFVMGMG